MKTSRSAVTVSHAWANSIKRRLWRKAQLRRTFNVYGRSVSVVRAHCMRRCCALIVIVPFSIGVKKYAWNWIRKQREYIVLVCHNGKSINGCSRAVLYEIEVVFIIIYCLNKSSSKPFKRQHWCTQKLNFLELFDFISIFIYCFRCFLTIDV